MKKVLVVLLVLIVAVGAFLYFPRGGVLEAANAAILGVLNGDVESQRSGKAFEPALDGDLLAGGDFVRSNKFGRGFLTFFDGSTLSIEPGSEVKVLALARTSGDGLQVTIEQSAGRTWASVQKLVTPDSRFELRTPSMTAIVRGTTFETIVERLPDGTTTTTVLTGEGEVVARAEAGGETRVPAGTQVKIQEKQVAPPAAVPQPPRPKLTFGAAAGVGFTVIDPRGLSCGGTARQIPHCDVGRAPSQSVVITDVVPGTYSIAVTAAASAADMGLVAIGGLGDATHFRHTLSRSIAVGDLVRTNLPVTVGPDGRLASTGFTPPEQVTSVCGAEATGRVFSSGAVLERGDALKAYGRANRGQPAAVVVTARELKTVATENVSQAARSGIPATVSDVDITVDAAGMHLLATVAAGPLSVRARGDIIAGAVAGKLQMRVRNFDAGLIPDAIKQQIVQQIDRGLTEFTGTFPLVVQRVAFRPKLHADGDGCLAIIGTTP